MDQYTTLAPANNSSITNENDTSITSLVTTASSITYTQQYAINVTYIIIAFFGTTGNLLSLLVIITHVPIRRRLLNYYFINKTIVDLLVNILLIPSVTVGLIPFGYSTYLLCLIWQSRVFFLSLYNVSVYSFLALSIERYLEIVHPIWHKLNVTKKTVISTIIVTWLIGFVQKFSYILPTTKPVKGVCMLAKFYPSLAISTVAGVFNCFMDFILPLFLLSFCYIQMWLRLRNKVKSYSGPTVIGHRSSLNRARRHILKTLIIIVTVFVLSNTHRQTLLLLKFFYIVPIDLSSVNFNISQILAFMNAAIDPYIYLLNHREFQIGFRKLLKLKRRDMIESLNVK